MPVPEAAMDEDYRLVAREDEVRLAGQFLYMQPEPQTERMQCPADLEFRLRVGTSDRRHIAAARDNVVNVGHASGRFASPDRLDQSLNMGLHNAGHGFKYRNCHRVAELLVSLRVRHGNAEVVTVTHKPRALARRQATRIAFWPLTDEDFRPVFVVSG